MIKPPKIPNVAWRDGRPRFMPGEPIRKIGYKGEDLRHADGRWFSAGEALDWSRARAAEIAAKRAGLLTEANRKRPKGARLLRNAPVLYTLANLFDDWKASPRWNDGEAIGKRKVKPLSPATRNNYRWAMSAIEGFDHDLYHSAVDALDATIVFGLFEELWTEKGLSSARRCVATISSAISWGQKRGRVNLATNPAQRLGMQMPDVVVRFGEREEIAALVAAADLCGRPEVGDMVILGLWTGQRQGDRLAMIGDEAGLVRGRRVVRQRKTGRIVSILQAPALEKRLAAMQLRRKAAGIDDPHLVLDERQGIPFKSDHYRHVFADVRALAVAGLKVGETPDEAVARAARQPAREPAPRADVVDLWRLRPCPSLASFHDKHLRATSVVWMALGGATIPEIISVTGHTAGSATTILKHYLASHPEMADAAIGKMMAWDESGEGSGIAR